MADKERQRKRFQKNGLCTNVPQEGDFSVNSLGIRSVMH